jgi:hypothetical protein
MVLILPIYSTSVRNLPATFLVRYFRQDKHFDVEFPWVPAKTAIPKMFLE